MPRKSDCLHMLYEYALAHSSPHPFAFLIRLYIPVTSMLLQKHLFEHWSRLLHTHKIVETTFFSCTDVWKRGLLISVVCSLPVLWLSFLVVLTKAWSITLLQPFYIIKLLHHILKIAGENKRQGQMNYTKSFSSFASAWIVYLQWKWLKHSSTQSTFYIHYQPLWLLGHRGEKFLGSLNQLQHVMNHVLLPNEKQTTALQHYSVSATIITFNCAVLQVTTSTTWFDWIKNDFWGIEHQCSKRTTSNKSIKVNSHSAHNFKQIGSGHKMTQTVGSSGWEQAKQDRMKLCKSSRHFSKPTVFIKIH